MLIQVVHSHPLADSYNHALFHTIVETLKPRHEVIATDLYREGFSPAMTEAERRSYYQGPYAEDAVHGSSITCGVPTASSSAFRIGGFRCLPCSRATSIGSGRPERHLPTI